TYAKENAAAGCCGDKPAAHDHVHHEHTHHEHVHHEHAPAVKDPVCGMTVDPATAKHVSTHDGQTFYFCSAGCKAKFDASPATYAKENAA
ncbi:YHS domain-containing protein, partial [Rhodanobacter thiooxydans]